MPVAPTTNYQLSPVLVPSVASGVAPVSPYVGASMQAALMECSRFTRYLLQPNFPEPGGSSFKLGSTAHGLTQKLRRMRTGYNDIRTLESARQYLDNTAFGPLPLAVERAIQRHRMRGEGGPVPILAIGAGARYVPWGLKRLYGDEIQLHELSPVYSSLRDAVDVEMEPSTIEDASLADSAFELVYSLFGTFYAGDQAAVLQKIVDALKVGGETCVMWKPWSLTDSPIHSFRNERRASLMNRYFGIFMQGGLHAVAEGFRWSGISGGKAHVVWGRKMRETVDVADLFQQAQDPSNQDDESQFVRLSQGGPLFPGDFFGRHHLLSIATLMIRQFRASVELDAETQYFKITDRRPKTSNPDMELADYIFRNSLAGRFYRGIPLSFLIMGKLQDTLQVLDTDESYPAMQLRMTLSRHGANFGGHRA